VTLHSPCALQAHRPPTPPPPPLPQTPGFDGQLNAKMSILRSCPAFISSLGPKSDLRGLAYVATTEAYSWGSRVYAAGQPCHKGAVFIIQEGSCRVSATRLLNLSFVTKGRQRQCTLCTQAVTRRAPVFCKCLCTPAASSD
jgi:hypothetical protein